MKDDVYKMMADQSTDVISRHTPDGVYLYASPSSENVLGYTQDELLGKNVFKLFHPDDLDVILDAHNIRMGTNEAETLYYRIKTKYEGYKWVETVSKIIEHPETGGPGELLAFTRDVSKRRKYEEELKACLHEKELQLNEIHHRVKNNLTFVAGLISMQKMALNSPEFDRVATDCELRIRSISLVHEKLYTSTGKSQIDFVSYITSLVESIQQIFDSEREVAIRFDCTQVALNINQAFSVALVLNELITNAYKYAFQGIQDKMIMIKIREEKDMISIEFRDNGVGIKPEFDYKQSSSMGFTIIRSFVEQLNANLEFTSNGGTEVRMMFRKAAHNFHYTEKV